MNLVDARGHRCPVPTLRLRRALEAAGDGETVVLLADDPLAKVDVPHFVQSQGWRLLGADQEGGAMRFTVLKSS